MLPPHIPISRHTQNQKYSPGSSEHHMNAVFVLCDCGTISCEHCTPFLQILTCHPRGVRPNVHVTVISDNLYGLYFQAYLCTYASLLVLSLVQFWIMCCVEGWGSLKCLLHSELTLERRGCIVFKK